MNTSMKKSDTQIKRAKGTILIALMFLSVMSPKAWGYAQKELPPPSSEESFSSNENVYLSRAILTDEKGVAICQINLQENPEFLPGFAEPGSSNTLRPLDLPECEEQSLDIVAQYAEEAWIKRDVAIAPVLLGVAAAGCVASFIDIPPVVAGAASGVAIGAVGLLRNIPQIIAWTAAEGVVRNMVGALGGMGIAAGVGAVTGLVGGLVCSGIEGLIFYVP